MAVYYNDADPAACAWLRELIAAGFLPLGATEPTLALRRIVQIEGNQCSQRNGCRPGLRDLQS
jgi:hypothetical protein